MRPLRLGGMALRNGVLVHGPMAWACEVRNDVGALKVTSERKRLLASGVERPFLRGPARLAEAFAFLPRVRRVLPEAEFPFDRRTMIASIVGSAVVVEGVRRSRLGDTAAEHIAIGSYEHGEQSAKEHERCGSHLIGPMLLASTAGNLLAARAPARFRAAGRLAATALAACLALEHVGPQA